VKSKTQFVVVRVMKDWSADEPKGDRRRYRRFESEEICGNVGLIGAGGVRLTLDPCTLLDVSYGGMCLLARAPLAKGVVHRLLIDFAAPFSDTVLVKARVAWMQPSEAGLRVGVEFVESSKGWLGPERDPDG